MYVPLSEDKQRIVQKVHPHTQMVIVGADVIVTQITTVVCGNVATVTSYRSCISYAIIAVYIDRTGLHVN